MARKFDLIWKILDIPLDTIVGVMAGSLVLMAWISFFLPHYQIPSQFMVAFGTILTGALGMRLIGGKGAEGGK